MANSCSWGEQRNREIQKLEYLRDKRNIFSKIKNIFQNFLRAFFSYIYLYMLYIYYIYIIYIFIIYIDILTQALIVTITYHANI